MEALQIIVLAITQGITEFLPVSSSAHLILVPHFLGWPDQGIDFDIAVHIGTLLAIITYFRRELGLMIRDWFKSLPFKEQTEHSRLAWAVALGTIPVGLCGLLLKDWIEINLRSPWTLGVTTLFFGLLLGFADLTGTKERNLSSLNWRAVLIIGLAQALALIPGTSRSGITMTAALLIGFNRQDAARFSFLLAIPVILLAGSLAVVDLWQAKAVANWQEVGFGTALAALSAYVCIHTFLKFLDKMGMMPFVVYRILLAMVIFWSF